jgi:acyl-lipid omega-6 desaturase (Delta-12 desaturase)
MPNSRAVLDMFTCVIFRGTAQSMLALAARSLSTESAAAMPTHQPIARRELVMALREFATIETRAGLFLYTREFALLLLGMALALYVDNLAVRLLGSVLAGFKIGSLYTLSHDASHYSLVRPRWLNKVLGTIGFMPALLNYRLWQYDHVVKHHPNTNGPQKDIHRPMSLEEYRQAPAWRRAFERLARGWNPLGRLPYFIVGSRWLQEKVVPNRAVHPAKVRREAWPASLLLFAYVSGLLSYFALRHDGHWSAFAADLSFGLLIPVALFQISACIVTGIQHLHPEVPWFGPDDARFAEVGQEVVTTNWRVPLLLGKLMHFSLDHAAHHMAPGVPSRRLREAQDRLNALLEAGGHSRVVVPLTFKSLRDVYDRCKLYDYENHQWLDFNGRPTSRRLLADRAGAAGAAGATRDDLRLVATVTA